MKIYNIIKFALFVIIFASCHKSSNSIKDCGCGGTIYLTVTDEIGTLSSDVTGKKLTISGSFQTNGSGPYYFTICNTDAVKDLMKTGTDKVQVIFTGDIYKVCDAGGIQPQDAILRGFITIHSIKKDLP